MSDSRTPLAPLSTNRPIPRRQPAPKPLYPIFLNSNPRIGHQARETGVDENLETATIPYPAYSEGPDGCPGAKRCKVDGHGDARAAGQRDTSLHQFFAATPLRSKPSYSATKLPVEASQAIGQVPRSRRWRVARRRLGVDARQPKPFDLSTSPLSAFLTRVTIHGWDEQPWTVTLPSFQSPTGIPRDYDPALVVAFSAGARRYTFEEARDMSAKRLLAVGGEEGGLRIVNVDASSDTSGADLWWRAHGNGILDLKWTSQDSMIASASADQTLRLHDLGNGTPRTIHTLVGHTSTIKSMAFLDASRSRCDEQNGHVIASGGRDGNINIYDVRCRGMAMESSHPRRSARARPTTPPQDAGRISPVMVIRQPHNLTCGRRGSEPRSVARTITSLIALQSMPGVLASGGSYDGVVKLWDVRFPETSRPRFTSRGLLPDPTTHGVNPSRRPRSVKAMCEHPSNGDLYALCGDSQIHVLRPSAATADGSSLEAILPTTYAHAAHTPSFYVRMAMSADGNHLACGSSQAGVMVWDVTQGSRMVQASRFPIPRSSGSQNAEVIAVDWGKDMLAASSDDCSTRLWRKNPSAGNMGLGDWAGVV